MKRETKRAGGTSPANTARPARAPFPSFLPAAALLLLSAASCVKDGLHSTPHPSLGAVVASADWSARSAEAEVPAAYTLRAGGAEQSAPSGSPALLGTLLPPGVRELSAHTVPRGVGVSGGTATVAASPSDGPGFADPWPGYLFSGRLGVTVPADDTVRVSVPMRQLTRLLEVSLEVEEGDFGRVQGADATLGGVASEVDLATEARGGACSVRRPLSLDGGRLTASFRLLGTVPSVRQTLTVSLRFTDGDTKQVESDVTGRLSGFNGPAEPLRLTGGLRLPVGAGTGGATVTGWREAPGGGADAE